MTLTVLSQARGAAAILLCASAGVIASLGAVTSGCDGPSALRPELAAGATSALALSDALEALIAEAKDVEADREAAYDLVQTLPANTAADAFGRAAIAGRLAERRGALSILGSESPTSLAAEAEKYALLSRKLDPEFRQGAATRMLGTLYVLAPANLLEGGNSEEGLELLEALAKAHPDVVDNQLRLAEAYLALGDKEPAKKPLCICVERRATLRKDHAGLLDKLLAEVPGLECKGAAAPPASGSPNPPPEGAP